MSSRIENNLNINVSLCEPTCAPNDASIFEKVSHTLNLWDARIRQRKQLAKLDDRMLEDIGRTRSEVNAEIAKPFWK